MSEGTKPGADNQATPEQIAKATADAQKAERARVSGIQSCEEAKGRESLANHLAFNTSMSIDEAKAMLAAAPKADAAATNGFKAAMDAGNHPNVGADGGNGGNEGGEKLTGAKGIIAAARAAGVRGFEQAKSA